MPQKYQFNEIHEKSNWERHISAYEFPSFFLSWEWGELDKLEGFGCRRFAIQNSDGDRCGIFAVRIVRARRGKYLHLRHSPLLNWNDADLLAQFRAFIADLAKTEGVYFVRISPQIANSDENREKMKGLGFVDASSHAVDAEETVVISLDPSAEELLAKMRKSTRYSIRQAEKLGIEVLDTDGDEYFDSFWEILQETAQRQSWHSYGRETIKRFYDYMRAAGMARMFVTFYKGEMISAAIFVYYNGQTVYYHSGSLSKYRNIPATYLLQWRSILKSKELGMKRHNLWGVAPKDSKNHPWAGLTTFKRGFGGEDLEFLHAQDLVIHPFGYLSRLYDFVERKLRGY